MSMIFSRAIGDWHQLRLPNRINSMYNLILWRYVWDKIWTGLCSTLRTMLSELPLLIVTHSTWIIQPISKVVLCSSNFLPITKLLTMNEPRNLCWNQSRPTKSLMLLVKIFKSHTISCWLQLKLSLYWTMVFCLLTWSSFISLFLQRPAVPSLTNSSRTWRNSYNIHYYSFRSKAIIWLSLNVCN